MSTPDNSPTSEFVSNGKVFEALPNTLFRVKLDDEREVLCYLAGKMRINKIRVLLGDTVTVQLDPYGGRGRIIKRM
jgi:translation initiation factor IF-1